MHAILAIEITQQHGVVAHLLTACGDVHGGLGKREQVTLFDRAKSAWQLEAQRNFPRVSRLDNCCVSDKNNAMSYEEGGRSCPAVEWYSIKSLRIFLHKCV